MAEPESFEKKKGLRKKWDSLTSGAFGYVVYAALGIFIAFVLNQALAYGLHTDLPVVAVVSGSMDHGINEGGTPCINSVSNYSENFDSWWGLCKDFYLSLGISKDVFLAFPYHDGFKKGDMPIVESSRNYSAGDIIVYTVPNQNVPIIHRIVKINFDGSFETKGDHNPAPIPFAGGFSEYSIQKNWIHGKVIFIFPKLGYFKVILTDILSGGRL